MAKSKQIVKSTDDVAVAEQAPIVKKVRVTTEQRYKLGERAQNAGPRTSGAPIQNSNTQAAWNAVLTCIQANGGVATTEQLSEALKSVGLLFKTYVPYFTNRCHWLAYADKE